MFCDTTMEDRGPDHGKMYGLLLEAIVHYISKTYGENVWLEVRKIANIQQLSFTTHERYSETIIPSIARAVSQLTGIHHDDVMDQFGVCFVYFVGRYGYDRILKVLGRHMTDFLNGLDNLHEYLRFSYPKLRPPSFFVEEESVNGLTLHYRSKRKGYVHYVKGQIRQVGKMFYNTKVDIDVISIEESEHMVHVKMKVLFDNIAFKEIQAKKKEYSEALPLSSEVFFELFPFHIVFNEDMTMRSLGQGLTAIMPDMMGKKITEVFTVVLPLVSFNWYSILARTNNAFELLSVKAVRRRQECPFHTLPKEDQIPEGYSEIEKDDVSDEGGYALHLKGQMMYMQEWASIIFLGTPIMESLDMMFKTGLYINDLSMHDSSRDLVLAGTQQSAELKLALDQEQEKSKILEESMQKLDAEMRRTDTLLYQMIPREVAERLRRGEPAINTCQVFNTVTILFSDVVGFTRICSQISPMEVVSMLNAMYTEFDKLSEIHHVYKVETIGDAYMVVSGAPSVTKMHAILICNMALDMLLAMGKLRDPSTNGHMKIRVGIHSGNVVAGVVGLKMPRYCLFGDTVNTASRMETTGDANRIHISETTRQELVGHPYSVTERGRVCVKGKGNMKSYWLEGKEGHILSGTSGGFPESIVLEDFSKANISEDKISELVTDCDDATELEMRKMYSPVSYEDVWRSKASTPCGSPSLQTYSRTLDERDNSIYNNNLNDLISKRTDTSLKMDREMVIIRSNIGTGEVAKFQSEANRSQTCALL